MHLHGREGEATDDIYFIANAHWEEHTFELPHLTGRRWCRFVDTMQTPPHDIAEPGAEATLAEQRHYPAGARSVVVLVSSSLTT